MPDADSSGSMLEPERFLLDANDWVPNNARLPVLFYRAIEQGDCETIAAAFETRFAGNGWPANWRDTVFDYHHYHSTAHEALGIAAGSATLEIGGPGAKRLEVRAGDAVVLPVGTGHRRIGQSDDFLVVGAYPDGQTWDICREAPTKQAAERIHAMSAPARDPVNGSNGWPGEQNRPEG